MSLARSARRNPPSRRRSARAALGAAVTLLSSLVVPMAAGAARPVPSVHVAGLTDATPSGLLESRVVHGPVLLHGGGHRAGPGVRPRRVVGRRHVDRVARRCRRSLPVLPDLGVVHVAGPVHTRGGPRARHPRPRHPWSRPGTGPRGPGPRSAGRRRSPKSTGSRAPPTRSAWPSARGAVPGFRGQVGRHDLDGGSLTVPDDTSDLQSVSCSTSTDCVATGSQSVCPPGLGCLSSAPVVAVWDGAWTLPAVPTATAVFVRPVDCPAPTTTCVAVGAERRPVGPQHRQRGRDLGRHDVDRRPGSDHRAGQQHPLRAVLRVANVVPGSRRLLQREHHHPEVAPVAELWDGSSLTVTTPQDPSATFAQLLGVDCTSATSCVAVGSERRPVGSHTPVERGTGPPGRWCRPDRADRDGAAADVRRPDVVRSPRRPPVSAIRPCTRGHGDVGQHQPLRDHRPVDEGTRPRRRPPHCRRGCGCRRPACSPAPPTAT